MGGDPGEKGRGDGRDGVAGEPFEAVPAKAAEGDRVSKRSEQITVLFFNYSQPHTSPLSLRFVLKEMAYHCTGSREL